MHILNAAGDHIPLRSRKARALLAVLALAPEDVLLRHRAAALLWSLRGKDQALGSLRQAVHDLQDALKPDADLLRTDRTQIVLRKSAIWVDAVAFATATPTHPEPLALYSPTLLEDLNGIDPAFDRWIAETAERLAAAARRLGEHILAEQHGAADKRKAAERLLRIDRAHEAAWRAIIRLDCEAGDHAAALAAYEQCHAALAAAGQAIPSAETRMLIEQVRTTPPVREKPASLPMPALPRSDDGGPFGSVRIGVPLLRTMQPLADDGLAWALTAELAAALTQFRWISCVPISIKAGHPDEPAGDPTDFDFRLDGTLQRAGGRVRVIVRLSDLHAGGVVIWGRRFDRALTDVFALQEDIAAEAAAQIDTALLQWEAQRARRHVGGDPTAFELMLRAIPSLCRVERRWFDKAGALLEAAVERDPTNAAAHAWLAHWHMFLVGQGWAPDPAQASARAGYLSEEAVRLDPADARILTLAGHVRGFLTKRPEEARVLHERAIDLNPNLALAWCLSGLVYSYLGNHLEATRRIEHARRLSPQDPHMFFFDTAQIMPHLLRGEYAQAAEAGRRANALTPDFTSALKGRLSALGHLGREAEATDVRQRLRALEPAFRLSTASARSPMARDEDIDLYLKGLRRAGVPD